jgi:hypothetical protein
LIPFYQLRMNIFTTSYTIINNFLISNVEAFMTRLTDSNWNPPAIMKRALRMNSFILLSTLLLLLFTFMFIRLYLCLWIIDTRFNHGITYRVRLWFISFFFFLSLNIIIPNGAALTRTNWMNLFLNAYQLAPKPLNLSPRLPTDDLGAR